MACAFALWGTVNINFTNVQHCTLCICVHIHILYVYILSMYMRVPSLV